MRERKRCPSHPGKILKSLYLDPLKVSITKFANNLSVSRKTISAIVNEKKSITPDIALRISKAFPNSTAESWLNLQKNFDLWHAAQNSDEWKSVKPLQMLIDEDIPELRIS